MTTIFWGDSHAEGGARALRGVDKAIVGAQLGAVRASYPPSSIPRGSTVVIQIGTNDLTIHSGWSDAQIRNHAAGVIRTALEMRSVGSTPVVFAVPIPERPYTEGWTAQTLREFQANASIYNVALRDQARAAGINFVNFQPNSRDFSSDNLHLTATAYQRMFAMANGVSFSPSTTRSTSNVSSPITPRLPTSPPPRAVVVDAQPSSPPPVMPPPVFTPALNTALQNFLTGDATVDKITALKGAVNVTDSNPAGHLDGRGGMNGAATLERTRTALGGALSATNHPELYELAKARYSALTGLPTDRAATPDEINRAKELVEGMSETKRAEYQSVAYLLGGNEQRLSTGSINVDGIQGSRTRDSIAETNARLYPTPSVMSATPVASADITTTPPVSVVFSSTGSALGTQQATPVVPAPPAMRTAISTMPAPVV